MTEVIQRIVVRLESKTLDRSIFWYKVFAISSFATAAVGVLVLLVLIRLDINMNKFSVAILAWALLSITLSLVTTYFICRTLRLSVTISLRVIAAMITAIIVAYVIFIYH